MLNSKYVPPVEINYDAKIITADDGKKTILLNAQIIPTRHYYGVANGFRTEYKNNMPLEYVSDFEGWLKGKEAKKRNFKKRLGPLASIIEDVSSFFYLPCDEYFKPDKNTGIIKDSGGQVKIMKVKKPEDFLWGAEGDSVMLSSDEYALLLSEAEKYAVEMTSKNT